MLHPEAAIYVISGAHEELYEELVACRVEAVFGDRRRAFSEEYADHILARRQCHIEIATHNPIAVRESVDVAVPGGRNFGWAAGLPGVSAGGKGERGTLRHRHLAV